MSKFVSMYFSLVLALSAINVARADDSQGKDVKGATKDEVRVPASTHADQATQGDDSSTAGTSSDGDKGFTQTARERRF
jgi:hypothetical protein